MNKQHIDLRSDTVTWPTDRMRQAMAQAAVGDDVYGDDPTVNKLEEEAAGLLAKEAALFVPSGTMGNQLALMAQVERGNEVILSDRSHILVHEAGAAAILAGAQLRTLPTRDGQMDLDQVEAAIRKDPADIHSPRTDLICLENADSDGIVLQAAYLEQIKQLAAIYKIPVHLDGARIFNAEAAGPLSARQIAASATTVQICLSKGLCAPVGSLLLGPAPVIQLARRKRKILGGGMRQAGILAAAGLVALREHRQLLGQDNAKASWLAQQLIQRPQWFSLVREPKINLLFFRLTGFPVPAGELAGLLARHKILVNGPEEGVFRLATHYWLDQADLEKFITILFRLGQAG